MKDSGDQESLGLGRSVDDQNDNVDSSELKSARATGLSKETVTHLSVQSLNVYDKIFD